MKYQRGKIEHGLDLRGPRSFLCLARAPQRDLPHQCYGHAPVCSQAGGISSVGVSGEILLRVYGSSPLHPDYTMSDS